MFLDAKSTRRRDEHDISLNDQPPYRVEGQRRRPEISLVFRIVLVLLILCILYFLIYWLLPLVMPFMNVLYTIVGIFASIVVIYDFLVKKWRKG